MTAALPAVDSRAAHPSGWCLTDTMLQQLGGGGPCATCLPRLLVPGGTTDRGSGWLLHRQRPDGRPAAPSASEQPHCCIIKTADAGNLLAAGGADVRHLRHTFSPSSFASKERDRELRDALLPLVCAEYLFVCLSTEHLSSTCARAGGCMR